jgi:hypothetical protein
MVKAPAVVRRLQSPRGDVHGLRWPLKRAWGDYRLPALEIRGLPPEKLIESFTAHLVRGALRALARRSGKFDAANPTNKEGNHE